MKLVIADINETILPPGVDEPSEATLAAVGAMDEQGIALAPVSSLSIPFIGDLARKLHFSDEGILDGGATIFNFSTGERDYELSRWLSPEKDIQIVSSIGALTTEIYYDQLSQKRTPDTIDLNEITEEVPSVFAVVHNNNLAEISKRLKAIPGINSMENTYDATDHLSCVQIVQEGVSKGSGVLQLLRSPRYKYLKPEDILVIADGKPDVDMFNAMPEGAVLVAVENAHPELKAVPGVIIAPSVFEDGFAQTMWERVLR